jgi:hypothetical protein
MQSRVKRWFSGNSAVYITVRNALKRGKEAGQASDIFALYEVGPIQTERVRSLAAGIQELRAAVEPAKSKIVLVYFPLAIEHKIDEMARAAGSRASSLATLELARRTSEESGVPLVDCSPALEAVRNRGERVTLVGDNHYGPVTSREVAELMWRALDWKLQVKQ